MRVTLFTLSSTDHRQIKAFQLSRMANYGHNFHFVDFIKNTIQQPRFQNQRQREKDLGTRWAFGSRLVISRIPMFKINTFSRIATGIHKQRQLYIKSKFPQKLVVYYWKVFHASKKGQSMKTFCFANRFCAPFLFPTIHCFTLFSPQLDLPLC